MARASQVICKKDCFKCPFSDCKGYRSPEGYRKINDIKEPTNGRTYLDICEEFKNKFKVGDKINGGKIIEVCEPFYAVVKYHLGYLECFSLFDIVFGNVGREQKIKNKAESNKNVRRTNFM